MRIQKIGKIEQNSRLTTAFRVGIYELDKKGELTGKKEATPVNYGQILDGKEGDTFKPPRADYKRYIYSNMEILTRKKDIAIVKFTDANTYSDGVEITFYAVFFEENGIK